MEFLTWFLTFSAFGVWIAVGVGILRSPPRAPRRWSAGVRRIVWAALGVAALVAGHWGPELWARTDGDFNEDSAVGAVSEASTSFLRTPFAVRRSSRELDVEGNLIWFEDRLVLQLPVALLLFLALVFLARRHERRPGKVAAEAKEGPAPAGRGTALLLVAFVTAGGCGGEPMGEEAPRPDRLVSDTAWDTLVHLQPAEEDTLLYSVNHAVGSERGFWLLDAIGARVAHFGWDGELRWYAGRSGAGPGEFRNPRMLELDEADRVWVLDAGNQRITGFDPDGEFVDEVSVRDLDGILHNFSVGAGGDRFYGMLYDERLRPVSVDRDSRVERGSPIRIRDRGESFGMALQGVVAGVPGTDAWIYAFSMGDGLFLMDGTEVVGERVRYPEFVPFPGVRRTVEESSRGTSTTTELTEANFSARGVAIGGGRLLTPFLGASPDRGRLLDVYDLEGAGYVRTILLPRSARVGAWGDRLILFWHDPGPEVLVIRERS